MLWLNLVLFTLVLSSSLSSKINNNVNKDPPVTKGLLYPFESESREIRSLDGMWRFLKSKANDSFPVEDWFNTDLDKVSKI